jgi:small subunit ribosomal protein S21
MNKNNWSRNYTTPSYGTDFTKGGVTIANSSRAYPSDAIQAVELEVRVQGNFDRAFKAFRSLVQKERILSLYKEKQSFEKPSDKKRRKRSENSRKLYEVKMRQERIANGETPRASKSDRYDRRSDEVSDTEY